MPEVARPVEELEADAVITERILVPEGLDAPSF